MRPGLNHRSGSELALIAVRYYNEHGEWPDDPPPKARRWNLPPGVMSPEDDRD